MKAQHIIIIIILLLSLLQTLVEPEGFQEVLNHRNLKKKSLDHSHTHIHAVAVVNFMLIVDPWDFFNAQGWWTNLVCQLWLYAPGLGIIDESFKNNDQYPDETFDMMHDGKTPKDHLNILYGCLGVWDVYELVMDVAWRCCYVACVAVWLFEIWQGVPVDSQVVASLVILKPLAPWQISWLRNRSQSSRRPSLCSTRMAMEPSPRRSWELSCALWVRIPLKQNFKIWSMRPGVFLSWKWLQTMESDVVNYQKRHLAMSWKTLIVHSCLCAKLGMQCDISLYWQPFRFFPFLPCAYGMPKAIPSLKGYRHTEALCPKKASLKSLYVLWCP